MDELRGDRPTLDYQSGFDQRPPSIAFAVFLSALSVGVILVGLFLHVYRWSDDPFWYAGMVIASGGIVIEAIRGDRRGAILCAFVFAAILGVAIILPSLNRAT